MIGKFIPIGGDDSLSDRKEFNVKTMKAHGANGYVGLRENGEDYHVYTKYWKFEPAWNGEGLPPVGCECEREVPRGWSRCRINYVSSSLIVYQMLDSGNEYASTLSAFKFRTIRNEAERKREVEVDELIDAITLSLADIYASQRFMDAIAAGKIPGVRLADD